MNPYALTTAGIAAAALGLAAWAVAKVLAIPDHETDDGSLFTDEPPVHLVTHDELQAARIARARALHPAFTGAGCSVIPFPTRPTAS